MQSGECDPFFKKIYKNTDFLKNGSSKILDFIGFYEGQNVHKIEILCIMIKWRENMIKHKSYMDINRFQTKYSDGFNVGDSIVIQEKIDGANASFIYDEEEDYIDCYSRKKTLDSDNTLNGFWNFVQTLDKDKYKKYKNYRFFGEWLIKHKVVYPEDKQNKFYLFDIWDENNKKYLDWNSVCDIAKDIGLETVPAFYEGLFISWEDCNKYVGKTKMGGEYGEGIVVKSMTMLNNPNTKLPFYVKIVAENFSEVQKSKVHKVDLEALQEKERLYNLAETIVTKNRIEKIIMKLVDNGDLRPDWDETDMKLIAKNLPKEVYGDCVKEEPEVVEEIGKTFGSIASKISMKYAREILANR